jgi:hypothetical protein
MHSRLPTYWTRGSESSIFSLKWVAIDDRAGGSSRGGVAWKGLSHAMEDGLDFRSWWHRLYGPRALQPSSAPSTARDAPAAVRGETMLGIPTDTLFAWSTTICLSALAIAAAATAVSYHLSARIDAAHVRELRNAQLAARAPVEASRGVAAQESARAARVVKASSVCQQEPKVPEFLRASVDPLDSSVRAIVPSDLLTRAE